MTTKSTLGLLLFLLVGLLSLWSCDPSKKLFQKEETNPSRPNIVIILADDLGWNDVGYHNPELITPNINQMTREGVVMDRYYTNKECSPTRAGLLTGRYPGRMDLSHGAIDHDEYGGIPDEEQTLPELLETAGYRNRGCIGKWHLGHSNIDYHPLNQGFTYFYGCYGPQVDYYYHKHVGRLDWHEDFEANYDAGYTTDLIGNKAVEFIEDNHKEPFFLYVPFSAVHTPLQAKREYLELYDYDNDKGRLEEINPPTQKEPQKKGEGNTIRQTYMAMVTSLDENVGKILFALKQNEIAENTLVLFLSDNGGALRKGGDNSPYKGRKDSWYEGGVHVPAVVKWPLRLPKDTICDQLMAYTDIFPTIQKIVGLEDQNVNPIDGINILPYWQGQPDTVENRILYLGVHYEYPEEKALITPHWKLVNGELYNIRKDPFEKENRRHNKGGKYKYLSDSLETLIKEIESMKQVKKGYKLQTLWEMPNN